METPTGTSGEYVKPADFNLIASALADLASWWNDLLAQQNAVWPGGGALTAATGTPIVVNYAGFTASVNGPQRTSRFVVPSGSVTLAAADPTYARYDLLVGTASQATVTVSGGNTAALDSLTVSKVTGTPSGSPTVPALPANSVQLGYVLVPANATSAATCTITQGLGPLSPKNLQDLTMHIAAVFGQGSPLHGFLVTTPGGTQATSLAETDASGRVGDSDRLAGHQPGSGNGLDADTVDGDHASAFDAAGAAGAVQTNLNTHAGTDLAGATAHGLMFQHGATGSQSCPNQQKVSFAVTFPHPFPGTPDVTATISGSFNQQYGAQCLVESVSSTGCTITIGQTSGGAVTVAAIWHAAYGS